MRLYKIIAQKTVNYTMEIEAPDCDEAYEIARKKGFLHKDWIERPEDTWWEVVDSEIIDDDDE